LYEIEEDGGMQATIDARHTMTRRLLDTLFPPRCVGCRARGHWICPPCLAGIERLPLPLCGVCRDPVDPAGTAHGCRRGPSMPLTISAVGTYAGPLREAVHALKYKGRHGIGATLAELLAPRVAPLAQDGDLLIPIPLHPSRLRERGYNQSAIVAAELARLLPLEPAPRALRRDRRTADQVSLSAAERVANLRGAFSASLEIVRDRRVWLLDDVYTTGATLGAATRALHDAGAGSVRAAVVAATLVDHRQG